MQRRVFIIAAVFLLICGGVATFYLIPPGAAEHLRQARAALRNREYDRAIAAAERVPRDDSLWAEAATIAGDAASRSGKVQESADFYAAVPRDGSRHAIDAAFHLAEFAFSRRRLFDAEFEYRYVLQHRSEHLESHRRMAFLLGVTGRRWESHRHFLFLAQRDECDLDQLLFLADMERPVNQQLMLQQFFEEAPNDVTVQLGLAAQAVQNQQYDVAQRLLVEIIERQPDLAAAHALAGEMLIDADDSVFNAWHKNLPQTADANPTIWFVRGMRARQHNGLHKAAHCFQATLRLAPDHRRAVYQFGQVLIDLRLSNGEDFDARARQLHELTRSVDDILRGSRPPEVVYLAMVEILENLGRLIEAKAWATFAARTTGDAEWIEIVSRLSGQINAATPPILVTHDPAWRYELTSFPIEETDSINTSATASLKTHGRIRFHEESDCGIDFEYNNGHDPSTPGVRMFEQNGGGVAVIDFDRDNWPDLFFPQGAEWIHGARDCAPSARTVDRLFRNRRGVNFSDGTHLCGIDEQLFSQGCTAGDYDNDGFPDLYVASVGRNRLFHNNGDGTFSEIGAQFEHQDWTSSCVLVDLNADGNPDLFDVNFVSGADVYHRICNERGCNPRLFPGVPDRLIISRGDGTFKNIPDATPTVQPKGLGIVAFDLQTRGRPDLFIANDLVPNFLLRNSPAPDTTANIQLTDVGFATGLAFDRDGLALACMGIAADDVDGDGRIDFFVTNFRHEPNTLYLQISPGHFVDATRSAQLDTPAMPYVGWGTQFLDADLNGDLDLVVVNGHIADYRDEGGEYHQRPQFFENVGDTQFRELTASQAGEYFDRKYLGRGLARIDWNRDGRMDFAVSNMLARASLVTNVSEDTGHFLNLRLHATSAARDAIGTMVEVTTDERQWTKQLVAGDGFMASNERMLQFGLGSADTATTLRVLWPSGVTQSFSKLRANTEWILIEGRNAVPSAVSVR